MGPSQPPPPPGAFTDLAVTTLVALDARALAALVAAVTFAATTAVTLFTLADTAPDTLRPLAVAAAYTVDADAVATFDTSYSPAVVSAGAEGAHAWFGTGVVTAAGDDDGDDGAIVAVIASRGRRAGRGTRSDDYRRAGDVRVSDRRARRAVFTYCSGLMGSQ